MYCFPGELSFLGWCYVGMMYYWEFLYSHLDRSGWFLGGIFCSFRVRSHYCRLSPLTLINNKINGEKWIFFKKYDFQILKLAKKNSKPSLAHDFIFSLDKDYIRLFNCWEKNFCTDCKHSAKWIFLIFWSPSL